MTRIPVFARLLPLSAALFLLPCATAVADTTPVVKACPSGDCLTDAQKRKLEVQPDPTEREVRARDRPANGQAQPEASDGRPKAKEQGKEDVLSRPASDKPN